MVRKKAKAEVKESISRKKKNLIWWIIGIIIIIIILAIIFLKYTGYAVGNSIASSTTAGCRDNDGGINYDVQGTVTVGDNIAWEDYCDSGYLHEGFCDGNAMKKETFLCPYGCLSGICKKCPSKTCSQLAKKCGNWDNGCGIILDCGICADGQICSSIGICVLVSKEKDKCSELNSEVKKTILSIRNSGINISLKEGEKVYSDDLFILNNKQGGYILKIDSIHIKTETDGIIKLSDYITKNSVEVALVNVGGIYKKEGLNIFGASNIKIQVDPNGAYAVFNWPLDNEMDKFECA